ncbi:MAG TPA: hypothetical protein ENJ08_07045 [Gammaproteobacteria bacterium]|nr:hypothetical protein [Gammaproteobacteria bacterium]
MNACYLITPQGVRYAIASNQPDKKRLLLLFILKKISDGLVSFDDVTGFYQHDKKLAFKEICSLLDLQLITLNEPAVNIANETAEEILFNNEFILSDLHGLIIYYRGFDPQTAQQISANACEFIRASRRQQQDAQSTPLCIETTWQNSGIKIYRLYLENFSCLLTSKSHSILDHKAFVPCISYLCSRYSYE